MEAMTTPTIAAGPAAWREVPVHQRGDADEGRDPSHPKPGQGGMVPGPGLLADVLPTERLMATGRPTPELRATYRRVPAVRNAANVVSVWLQSFGVVALACWLTTVSPWSALVVWPLAFALMGRAFALYAILGHEAAHRLLFANKRLNDFVGGWAIAYPAFVPLTAYRRGHMAHHRDEFGPTEPDLNLYENYPITRASLRRKLRRDAFGSSGWKSLKGLLMAFTSATGRPLALRIAAGQVMVFAVLIAIGGWSRWWLYPLLWLAPWMTVWRVINRLRGIAEHGGLMRSNDRRLTSHVVRQTLWARFWMVPFNTGWHLAHHVDAGVPFQHLPALHQELVDAGWVVNEVEYPNYRALWKALSSASTERQPLIGDAQPASSLGSLDPSGPPSSS
jgi:fatty acid desaturase